MLCHLYCHIAVLVIGEHVEDVGWTELVVSNVAPHSGIRAFGEEPEHFVSGGPHLGESHFKFNEINVSVYEDSPCLGQ